MGDRCNNLEMHRYSFYSTVVYTLLNAQAGLNAQAFMTNAGKAALSVSRPHYRNGDCVGIRHHYKKNLSCYTAFNGLKSRWNGETCIFISSERYCLLI